MPKFAVLRSDVGALFPTKTEANAYFSCAINLATTLCRRASPKTRSPDDQFEPRVLLQGEELVGARAWRVLFGVVSLPLAVTAVAYFINHRYDGVQLWNIKVGAYNMQYTTDDGNLQV